MSGSIPAILSLPAIPQPQKPGDVVGFVLQNPGSTELPARQITFGQVFATGQVPSGSRLVAVADGQQFPVQMDVKTTNPDGSVCSAVLTMQQPALPPNSSTDVTLSLAPTAITDPANLDLGQAIGAGGYDVRVDLSLQNPDGSATPYSFDVGPLLQQALANGSASYWLNGPQATEARFSAPVSGSLRLAFDVTAYADSSFVTDVQFDNDIALQASGDAVTYSATILQNGQAVSQCTNLTQYQYQDWHEAVYSKGAPQVNVQHDIPALEKTGVIQNYDLTTGVSSSLTSEEATVMSGAGWDTPLAANGVTQYMPLVGGRPDLGPTTEYNTAWLLSQNPIAAQFALGQADAAGAVPWHFYDQSEGSYITVTAAPKIWTDPRGVPNGLMQQVDTIDSGWTPDEAHQPDLSFVAYLMTGNQYYLDQLNAQASYDETNFWPDAVQGRNGAQGLLVNAAQQVRGMAWSMREIDEAAYANPDGSAEKAYFTQMEENNWSWLVSQIPAWTAEEGQAYGWIPNAYDQYTPPWEQDYFVSTAAQAAQMGNQDAKTFLQWETHFIAGRFLSAAAGFSPYDGFAYTLAATDSSLAPYTTWAQIEQATVAAGYSDNNTIPVGDYAALSLMGLADDISITESPLAMKAYGWVYAVTYGSGFLAQDPWYTGNTMVAGSDLAFNIVPRLPDGNSLIAGDVHLFNSTTAGSLTASGLDQLIYDLGSANDTLAGGPGTNLLFAGSGNDLLLANGTDNYLFGGGGGDTLVGGAGTNYLDASGVATTIGSSGSGPTTFVLASAIAASDTIVDFQVGRDFLAIADAAGQPLTAAGVQALIAGAVTDRAGDAVLQLSPTHSVTLDGIAATSLMPSMFSDDLLPCFAAGTRIATVQGETPVEALSAGDLVLTAGGRAREIVWIGQRCLDIRHHPRRMLVSPVRIRAGAFGGGLPRNDVLLSPDHAVFAGGVLIPVKHLINGATIVQEHAARVYYFHVELESHDILLAEGLAVESYLDTGNRTAFAEGGAFLQLHPDFEPASRESAYAPLCTGGAAVLLTRRRLLAELRRQGFRQIEGPAPYLLVDGRPIHPTSITGPLHRYLLPAGARNAVLVSRSGVPAGFDPRTDDTRRLGVAVAGIVIDGQPAPLDDPALGGGFHAVEGSAEDRWRWTDGAGEIALSRPRARRGPFVLDLLLKAKSLTWNPPELCDQAQPAPPSACERVCFAGAWKTGQRRRPSAECSELGSGLAPRAAIPAERAADCGLCQAEQAKR